MGQQGVAIFICAAENLAKVERLSFYHWNSTTGFHCWPNLRMDCCGWVSLTPSKGAPNAEVIHLSYQLSEPLLVGVEENIFPMAFFFVYRKAPVFTDQVKKDAY